MTTPRRTVAILNPGEPAPRFTAPAHPTGTFRLEDYRARANVVLYFYIGDKLPSSTHNLCLLSDALPRFRAAETQVFGVSRNSLESHATFADERGIAVPLLVDADAAIGKLYGIQALEEWLASNHGYDASAVFVIDKEGVLRHRLESGSLDVAGLLRVVEALE